MTDIELIEKILLGNKSLFSSIVERYNSLVTRTAFGFVHNKDDADDIAQEVFISIFRSLSTFKGESAFSTWVYRITINAALLHVKRNQRLRIFDRFENLLGNKNAVVLIQTDIHANPNQILENKQQAEMIHNAINQLTDNQRIAFTLSNYDDLSYLEIADVMHLSIPAVESLLFRARENLQKKLKKYYKK